jgi:transcriptional regulator with XRE-family HTH domain
MTVGERLREVLEGQGWSQQTLSKRSGVHYQQIYKLLHGETPDPRISTIKRLAKALGVSMDYLTGMDEEEEEEGEKQAKRKSFHGRQAAKASSKARPEVRRERTPTKAAKG